MIALFGYGETPGVIGQFLTDPGANGAAIMAWLNHIAAHSMPVIALAVVTIVLALAVVWHFWRHRFQQRLARNARVVMVLLPPKVDPSGGITLWSNMMGLLRPRWARWLGQPHLSFEYVADHQGVQVQLWAPGTIPPGMIERAVQAAWPGARSHTQPAAQMPTSRHGSRDTITVGGELRLARREALPIRVNHSTDPLRGLLGATRGLGVHERICVQILARPVTKRHAARSRRAPFGREISFSIAREILDLIAPGSRRSRNGSTSSIQLNRQISMENSTQQRAIASTAKESHFQTCIRYTVSAAVSSGLSANDKAVTLADLRGRAHAVASSFAAFSDHNYYRRHRLRNPQQAVLRRQFGHGDLLSVPELAGLAHLPIDDAIPGLHRAGAQAVPLPPRVPEPSTTAKPLGISDYDDKRPVGLNVADARHHVHILGATGSGKTELMARMILADAEAGRGVVAIDPRGDLVNDILSRVPEHSRTKVVLFDATSTSPPPILNPLDDTDPLRAVDHLVSLFARIYASSWGPRTDDVLRACLLTLIASPGVPTLVDIPRLLTESAFRQRAVSLIQDDLLRGFWSGFNHMSEASRAQVIAPLLNKLRGLLLRPFVRAAIAGGPSTVDIDSVLNDGGLCLVRISRDALGADTQRLLGSVIVARTWQAALRRTRRPQSHRPDASLYLDECQLFLNLAYPLGDMLAEARAYRLSIVLAHQYLAQLPKELAEGISTNARSKVFFTASPEDARDLSRHTMPRVTEHDLSHLDKFHIAARIVVDGQEAPAFTAITQPLPPPIRGRAATMRRLASNHSDPRKTPTHVPPGNRTSDPRRAI